MNEQHVQWHSPNLGRNFDMLIFGHAGLPLLLYPTSMGRHYQNRDFKLIESVAHFIDEGRIKIYCPDGIDEESWYNNRIAPAQRVQNHLQYEKMVLEEIMPQLLQQSPTGKIGVGGCSFGAYHATNFAFRHPEMVGYLFNMGGAFDIRSRVAGFYDDSVYFNNPPDYLPHLQHPALYEMGIVLGTSEFDMCRDANYNLSDILRQKNIAHWLDDRPNANHDWPIWRQMLPDYVAQIKW